MGHWAEEELGYFSSGAGHLISQRTNLTIIPRFESSGLWSYLKHKLFVQGLYRSCIKLFSVQLSGFGVNVKQFFLSSFLNKKLQLLVKNSLTESLRPGSVAVLIMCRIFKIEKVRFWSDNGAGHLIQTAHRVSTDSRCAERVRQTLSNLTLLLHQTKTAVPNWFRRRSFAISYVRHMSGTASEPGLSS